MIVNDIYLPNITSPVSGQVVNSEYLNIQWNNSVYITNDFAYYLIYFSDNYTVLENNFKMIGMLPIIASSFNWKVNQSNNSDKCMIGIKAKKFNGDYTNFSLCNGQFSINFSNVSSVPLVSPQNNSSYNRYILFSFDTKNIESQSYNNQVSVYYKSDSLNISWTLLLNKFSYIKNNFYFDTINMSPANDYSFKFIASDPLGNVSFPTIINNVSINPLRSILIDTEAPTGSVFINKTSPYTNNVNSILSLNAYDSTSGVSGFYIQQSSSNGNIYTGEQENMVDIYPWTIRGSDGNVCIEGKFYDYAGNISGSSNLQQFTQYLSLNNTSISAYYYDKNSDNSYTAIKTSPSTIYLNLQQLTTVNATINDIIVYNTVLYLGGFQNNNNLVQFSYNNGLLTTVYQSSVNDTAIEKLCIFNNSLYFGDQSGNVYVLNLQGNVTFLFNLNGSVSSMYSYNNLMYIGVTGNSQIFVYDGTNLVNTGNII